MALNHTIGVRVGDELKAKLDEIKNRTNVSFSDICRPILEKALLGETSKPPPEFYGVTPEMIEQIAAKAAQKSARKELQEIVEKFEFLQENYTHEVVKKMLSGESPNPFEPTKE